MIHTKKTEIMKLTDSEYEKLFELQAKCKKYYCFEFDGLLVDGYMVDVTKTYVKINPSKEFRTWLIDCNLVIKEL